MVQDVYARFSQRYRGLILADRQSMAISTQHPFSKWNCQILQEVPHYSGIHLFVSRNWKVEKVYEKIPFEEWPATANSVLAFCNPQTFKPFTRSLLDLLVERFSFECRKVIGFAFTTLCDWLKRFAPLFYPIRRKTKTNCVTLACIFPHFASATCNYFEF